MTYARARLRLGMAAVGTVVVLSAVLLASGAAARVAEPASWPGAIVLLAAFFALYAAAHLGFDVAGGFVLPRRHGRPAPALGPFLRRLLLAATIQVALLTAIAAVFLAAGRAFGSAGLVGAGTLACGALLVLRTLLARSATRGAWTDFGATAPAAAAPALRLAHADDPAFCGGIEGVLRPHTVLIPHAWRTALSPDAVRTELHRRLAAIESGAWRRGQLLAVAWTLAGIALVATLVVGDAGAGRVSGIVELSLGFTLWSFLGLLVLPTPSRWGVSEMDRRVVGRHVTRAALDEAMCGVDDLLDGEERRPALTEVIFHPVPSRDRRRAALDAPPRRGFWNAARLAVFLGSAGLGLLARSVHCNCGRPDLWVFLPTT